MILITVGTEKFQFNRLMQWIESLIEQNFIDPHQEDIVVQAGSCTLTPKGTQYHQVLPEQEFRSLLQRARLVIAHCGEGTLDLLANVEKPFVLVPRSQKFGEHVDDHQVELANRLAQHNIPIAYSPGDLVRFLQAPRTIKLALAPSACYAYASGLLNSDVKELFKSQRRKIGLVSQVA